MLAGSAITLAVVSTDSDLIALCKEVLRDLGDAPVDGSSQSGARKAPTICILDCESGSAIPPVQQSPSQTFYLVPPTEVADLLRTSPVAEGHIILKPVTRSILREFLRMAIPSHFMTDEAALRENRDDLLQRLLQANLRLQEYDQQRTNFIARAVHDFRAPLTSLSGCCGLLVSGQLGPLNENQREAVGRMENSAKRLSRMATAMFELGIGVRVDRKPDLHEGDIGEQIKQAIHEIQPLAREKSLTIKADNILAPDPPLQFDAFQIEQVLVNLLDNASKFTRRGGEIEVRAYPYFWERRFLSGSSARRERRVQGVQTPNSYRVDIRDTGPGIPADRLNHIFEEYTSYSGSRDRSGGGLGLAISRLIVSRHEGRIWAQSHQHGAVFSFVLPYRSRPASQETATFWNSQSQTKNTNQITEDLCQIRKKVADAS